MKRTVSSLRYVWTRAASLYQQRTSAEKMILALIVDTSGATPSEVNRLCAVQTRCRIVVERRGEHRPTF